MSGTAFDLVIRGARVVTADGVSLADVGVSGEEIAAIGPDLPPGASELPAQGQLLLPGGVDSHCHVEQMTAAGILNADSWETASRAALHGGTTTIIPFAAQHRGMDLAAVVADYHDRARAGAMVDYAFHMIVTDPTPRVLQDDLPALIAAGHGSIKVFMTYDPLIVDDAGLLALLSVARAEGAMVCVHAENHAMIKWATARLLAAGKTAPRYQAEAHPREAETEAVARLIALAELTRQPVMVFHVSTAGTLDLIRAARARGVPVWAETCPHYLYLTARDMHRPGMEGAKWMCSPPLRDAADQAALWQAVAAGEIDVISSDHAPFRPDASGKFAAGPDVPFNRIANGMPGLQSRMPLLMDAALRGRIRLKDAVRLGATAPADIYNLPRKGRIAIGADADLVLWQDRATTLLSDAGVQDATGYTPFDGMELQGAISAVWRRGQRVLDGATLHSRPGEGRFLPRGGGPAVRWPEAGETRHEQIED